jgi:hypothetical protein
VADALAGDRVEQQAGVTDQAPTMITSYITTSSFGPFTKKARDLR